MLERRHGMIMANILFNNHAHLYTPRSSKERKQKSLKLSDQKRQFIETAIFIATNQIKH